MVRAWRERGVLAPLRADLERTLAEPHEPGSLAPPTPAAPTISRRGLLALVASASAGLLVVTVGQSVGGPLRRLALLAPRGQSVFDDGPNGFPVNKTAATARITPALTGPDWRLAIGGSEGRELSRAQLLAMEQHEHDLPIACVEGWSTTQRWSGVRLRDLAALAGAPAGAVLHVGVPATARRPAPRHARPRPALTTSARCSRCASTAPTSRSTTATRRGSSCPRCPACTARNGSRA